MKFGKKYLETLASPGFPQEWRQTAIEYRKLKKVINRVASELEELGLTSEVLRDLLEKGPAGEGTVEELVQGEGKTVRGEAGREGKKFVWEMDSSADEGDVEGDQVRKRRSSRRRRARASYELAGTSARPEPRIRLIFSSASSDSLSDSSSDRSTSYPLLTHISSDTEPSTGSTDARFAEINSSEEDSRAKEEDGDSASANEEFEGAGPQETSLLKRMYGMRMREKEEEQDWAKVGVEVEPKGKVRGRSRSGSAATLRSQEVHEVEGIAEEEEIRMENVARDEEREAEVGAESAEEVNDEGDADDEGINLRKPRKHHHRPRRPRKEVFIPLNSDTEFLTLLAQALASLAALQTAQKHQFASSVDHLARQVSQVSSPSRPKSDLYTWREIFTLWVEAQIFESQREKDRGERSVEDAEEKLEWFVDQVAKRKLAKRMRHKESRMALEKFIKLNVELLDLKKFQGANEEAARKILKKHDKRTALTASHGFPQFIAAASTLSHSSELVPSTSSARVLILPGFPSLPHILLATFTTTLLPIIPQLEDYECSICGDVAFKPIRLSCGHKFCVRCLVKMQKRGQDACPNCRSPVVLRANAANLDATMEQFLKLWFPKEVREKEQANSIEAGREELEEMGLDGRCLVQ